MELDDHAALLARLYRPTQDLPAHRGLQQDPLRRAENPIHCAHAAVQKTLLSAAAVYETVEPSVPRGVAALPPAATTRRGGESAAEICAPVCVYYASPLCEHPSPAHLSRVLLSAKVDYVGVSVTHGQSEQNQAGLVFVYSAEKEKSGNTQAAHGCIQDMGTFFFLIF